MPRLTPRTLAWYLDDAIMPFLDEIHDTEGGWEAVPSLASIALAAGGGADGQRRAVRREIRQRLQELAGPCGGKTKEENP